MTENGDDLIGVMDVFRRRSDSAYELGYWVARDHWGKGYASEAAITVMNEVSSHLGISRFVAGVFADNPASMRVLEKIGFKKTGSEGGYFSMARLKHAESIGFELDMNSQTPNDLQTGLTRRIDAL